jgi:ketosteroid isomerase-like protein
MRKLDDITDLREAIATHAAALAAGDSAKAEVFVIPTALEAYRDAAAEIARIRQPVKVETLALAKVGFQYISKLRFTGSAGAMRRVLYRWRKEDDGTWRIVSVEDTTGKRSSWSDIPNLAAAIEQARAGNGNA